MEKNDGSALYFKAAIQSTLKNDPILNQCLNDNKNLSYDDLNLIYEKSQLLERYKNYVLMSKSIVKSMLIFGIGKIAVLKNLPISPQNIKVIITKQELNILLHDIDAKFDTKQKHGNIVMAVIQSMFMNLLDIQLNDILEAINSYAEKLNPNENNLENSNSNSLILQNTKEKNAFDNVMDIVNKSTTTPVLDINNKNSDKIDLSAFGDINHGVKLTQSTTIANSITKTQNIEAEKEPNESIKTPTITLKRKSYVEDDDDDEYSDDESYDEYDDDNHSMYSLNNKRAKIQEVVVDDIDRINEELKNTELIENISHNKEIEFDNDNNDFSKIEQEHSLNLLNELKNLENIVEVVEDKKSTIEEDLDISDDESIVGSITSGYRDHDENIKSIIDEKVEEKVEDPTKFDKMFNLVKNSFNENQKYTNLNLNMNRSSSVQPFDFTVFNTPLKNIKQNEKIKSTLHKAKSQIQKTSSLYNHQNKDLENLVNILSRDDFTENNAIENNNENNKEIDI